MKDFLEVVEQDENNDFLMASLIVMVMVGVFIIATAILGMVGACKNSRCLLIMVSIFNVGEPHIVNKDSPPGLICFAMVLTNHTFMFSCLFQYGIMMACIILAQLGAGVMAIYFRVNVSKFTKKKSNLHVFLIYNIK